jgi:hypothetical protein
MTIAFTQSGLFTGLCRSSVQSTEMVCSVLPARVQRNAVQCTVATWSALRCNARCNARCSARCSAHEARTEPHVVCQDAALPEGARLAAAAALVDELCTGAGAVLAAAPACPCPCARGKQVHRCSRPHRPRTHASERERRGQGGRASERTVTPSRWCGLSLRPRSGSSTTCTSRSLRSGTRHDIRGRRPRGEHVWGTRVGETGRGGRDEGRRHAGRGRVARARAGGRGGAGQRHGAGVAHLGWTSSEQAAGGGV